MNFTFNFVRKVKKIKKNTKNKNNMYKRKRKENQTKNHPLCGRPILNV